jgi:predicted nucleic acid-binding protein
MEPAWAFTVTLWPRRSHTLLELRQNLTPYDAAYVALAELLDAVLVTGDKRLSRSPGLRCRVQVIG